LVVLTRSEAVADANRARVRDAVRVPELEVDLCSAERFLTG
jgi:hypothetical protein